MIEFLFSILMIYVSLGVSFYLYIVVKNFEMTEVWDFKVGEHYIGISPYPKWLMWWMRRIAVRMKWN